MLFHIIYHVNRLQQSIKTAVGKTRYQWCTEIIRAHVLSPFPLKAVHINNLFLAYPLNIKHIWVGRILNIVLVLIQPQ